MKITFLDTKTVGNVPNLDRLQEFGTLTQYTTTAPSEVVDRVKDQDIVITNKVLIDRATMEAAPQLKLICVAATGMNNVDVEYAEQQGIAVKNVKGYSTDSVAQVTWSLILSLLQRSRAFSQYVYSGEYSQSDIFTYFEPPFWQVAGKRLGIIGLGTIGQQVARIGEAFGMEVIYYSTSGRHDHAQYERRSLQDLLATSDVISIHAPLNEKTENLLRYEQLLQMQPHALLINTGRGGIVNEPDLARAINEDIIGGAGIDVFTQEPIPSDHPYLSVKYPNRLLLTPHLGWASVEARTTLIEGVCENIQDFLAK